MAKKHLFTILLVIVTGILFYWFFLANENSYRIKFNTSVAPGVVYQKVSNWQFKDFQHVEMVEKVPFQSIRQKIRFKNDSIYLDWKFFPVNDTVTSVSARASKLNSSFGDKLRLLFRNKEFRKNLNDELNLLQEILIADKDFYSILINGKTISPESKCACIPLKSEVGGKAYAMMSSINQLSNFVLEHELKTAGRPRVIIQKWDFKKNLINFDFCFPLETEKEPDHPTIVFKKFPAQPSLKATYLGHYMFSDLAWYELLHYAKQHELKINAVPQEIFYDNPELGGDSRLWRAEIYLPLER